MDKKKETPWTEQKVMYKDGNVDVYRKFGWETWKRMTEGERAMWTELNENTPVPIPKEVIEFNKTEAEGKITDTDGPYPDGIDLSIADTTFLHIDDIEAEKIAIKKQLKELGIRFTHNSKLETLRKKLADADNPE